jgi:glycosyltransferase involved in cell wall biosynthesis
LDGIITISETVKKQLQKYTNTPIYNLGENISAEYKIAKNKVSVDYLWKWNLTPDSYYISVSTIEPRKNFNYLLEVLLPILKEQNRKLVLVGRKGWGDNSQLKEMIEKAGDRLIFTGYVEMEELFSLYCYAYAFALLSKDEGFGRTPFEAVACGCKRIILSDIEIFHETFEGNALFIPLQKSIVATEIIRYSEMPLVDEKFEVPFCVLENRISNEFFPKIAKI